MTETDLNKLCTLERILGHAEECPAGWCPFWEPGGTVAPGECRIERLALDVTDRAVAAHLLELRRALEQVKSREEAEAAHAQIGKLVPPDLADLDEAQP